MVESLKESHAVDEVKTLAAVAPHVGDDEVDVVRRAPDRRVQLDAKNRRVSCARSAGKETRSPDGAKLARSG